MFIDPSTGMAAAGGASAPAALVVIPRSVNFFNNIAGAAWPTPSATSAGGSGSPP